MGDKKTPVFIAFVWCGFECMDGHLMKAPVVEIAAVVVHYGAVLLVKRVCSAGEICWSLPLAVLPWGGCLQRCVEREVLAATGVVIRSGAVLHGYDRMVSAADGAVTEHSVVIEMEADYLGGELQPGAAVLDAAWVSALAIAKLDVDEKCLELLVDIGFI